MKPETEAVRRGGNGSPWAHLAADLILTVLAWFLAAVVRPYLPFGKPLEADYSHSLLLYFPLLLVWVLVFLLLSVYTRRPWRAVDEALSLIAAVTVAALTLAGVLYFTDRGVSRLQLLTFYALDLVFLVGYRLALRLLGRAVRRAKMPARRVLIVGAGEAGREMLETILRRPQAGLEPVGFLDDELPPGTTVGGYPVLGGTDDIAPQVQAQRVDEVVIALPAEESDRIFGLITHLRELPVRIRLLPDYVKLTLFRTSVEDFADVPLITLRQPALSPFERQVKRAFDLVVGGLALLLSLPLMVLIAIAIRLDTRGPVIYKQRRIGEGGKPFWMYKFRSMVVGADEQLDRVIHYTEDGKLLFKRRDDPRVTRVGRVLRRFSLDELPQLWNVLKGDMSLVGPRPELPWIVEQYEPWQHQRFAVPQGITGWWQVNGRSDKPMHLHTEEDLYYIRNYSFWLDVRILWATVGAVLKGRGAF